MLLDWVWFRLWDLAGLVDRLIGWFIGRIR